MGDTKTKGQHGGARPNSGRPSKADEIKKIEMMDKIGKPEEAWSALWDLVLMGDMAATKTWIEHRFGKPKETKDVSVDLPFSTIKNEFHDFSETTD